MQPVRLYTADGGFVVAGVLPPFQSGLEAEVLIWGERVFLLARTTWRRAPLREANGALVYREVFAVALVQTTP